MNNRNHVGNTALRDLLSSVKIKTKKEYRSFPNPFVTDLNKLGKDGVDHINISQHGNTELGRALSNEIPISVDHPIYGNFRSVTGFWYYIKSKERDDRCRELTGRDLKELSKTLTLTHVKNFRAIILDAVWNKIKQKEAIAEVMIGTELPYECYYEDKKSNSRKRLNYAGWFVSGLQDIREALLLGAEPNFSAYLDVRNSGIYDFVEPASSRNIDEELKELVHSLALDTVPSDVDPNELARLVFEDSENESEDTVEEVAEEAKTNYRLEDKITKLMEEVRAREALNNELDSQTEDSVDPYEGENNHDDGYNADNGIADDDVPF